MVNVISSIGSLCVVPKEELYLALLRLEQLLVFMQEAAESAASTVSR